MSKRLLLSLSLAMLALFCLSAAVAIQIAPAGDKDADNAPRTTVFVDSELIAGELRTYGELLGNCDDDAVNSMGSGTASYDLAGHLTSRGYSATLFGIMAEIIFNYENNTVTSIKIRLIGAVGDDVIDLISMELGDALSVQRFGHDLEAVWQADSAEYRLTENDDGLTIYLIPLSTTD